MNNRIMIGLTAVVIVLCIGIGLLVFNPIKAALSPQTVYTPTDEKNRTVNVSGNGKINVKPDVAYVNVGVITQNIDAKQAQKENRDIMGNIVKEVKSFGIKEEDIQTVEYNMNAQYQYPENSKPRISGYQVTNTVQLRIRDINKVGDILDITAEAGANQAYSIRFGLLDPDKAYKQALNEAITDAKEKADIIAKASNIQLMGPLSITETGSTQVYPNEQWIDARKEMAAGVTTPISEGEMEISASVDISFQIK